MKRKFFLLMMFLNFVLLQAYVKEELKVIDIIIHEDYYEIKAIKESNNQNFILLSEKEDEIIENCNYIEIENVYEFILFMVYPTIAKYSVRVKDKIIWTGDSTFGAPIHVKNLHNLCLIDFDIIEETSKKKKGRINK